MVAGSEPSGSVGLLSSGPRSALNPAAPWLLPSAASLTTGPAAEQTWNTISRSRYLHTGTQKDTSTQGQTHKHTLRDSDSLQLCTETLTKKLTFNIWHDMKRFTRITFRCFLPPYSHTPLLFYTF